MNEYHVADARQLGDLLGDQRVDVTITSPPYWDVKDYESADQIGYRQSYDRFMDDLLSVFDAVWRATTPDGCLWIVLDSIKKRGRVHLLPLDLANRLATRTTHSWHLQDVLIWHKPHSLPWTHSGKLQGHFEYILCLSKSRQLKLNLDALRTTNGLANWWVKYPERYHPLGKSVTNVWEYPIPTQGTWGNGHFAHYCPLPIEMVQRMILLSTQKKSQVVLDPFAGTGSVLVAAQSLGRSWVGVDVNRAFKQMFYRRLAHETPSGTDVSAHTPLLSTNLKLRQLKYAIQLYKRLAPTLRLTSDDVPLIVVHGGRAQRKPSPHWVCECRIAILASESMSAKRLARLKDALLIAQGRPPFSKYQLEVDVSVLGNSALAKDVRLFGKRPLYRYTQGHFWRSTPVNGSALLKKRKVMLPDIISDLMVNERPAY